MTWLALWLPLLAWATNAQAPRTVMVQLFEWPWPAVAEECERYLGPAGFAAVQISPVSEHVSLPGAPWWERYQPVSYRVESRGGSEAELADMFRRCRSAGVEVYVDVVLNHMTAQASGRGFAGTEYRRFEYPDLYSHGDFHHCGRYEDDGIRDFTSLYELLNCHLLGLSDLDTASPRVQEIQARYLNHLLDLGAAGFRVDAAKHMAASDIAGVLKRLKRSPYVVHELIVSPGEPVNVPSYLPLGDVNVFPLAYTLGAALRSGDMAALAAAPADAGIRSEDAVVFLDNHDLERRPPNESPISFGKDPGLYRLGQVFLLTWPYGYPQLFSGYAFRDFDQGPPLGPGRRARSPLTADGGDCVFPWTCAHRLPEVAGLVAFRNHTNANFRATQVQADREGGLSFGRGALGHVVINAGKRVRNFSVPTALSDGTYANLAVALGGPESVRVSGGRLSVRLAAGAAFVGKRNERK